MKARAVGAALSLLAAAEQVLADDDAALALADSTSIAPAERRDWRLFSEVTFSESRRRFAQPSPRTERVSLEMHYETALGPRWRITFADRLSLEHQDHPADRDSDNSLKELYLTFQAQPDQVIDLGRINLRYGVANGYSPTDFFRGGAIRSVVSPDPTVLKQNRLGTVAIQAQHFWPDGALGAVYSPKLADAPSDSTFNPNLGATNGDARWLIAGTWRLVSGMNPQWLLYGQSGRSPQMGVNLTGLLNDACVLYSEWSGGRDASLLARAGGQGEDTAFRNRLATGLTYTLSKLSMTLEYERNDAGLDKAGWNTLRMGPPVVAQRFAALAQTERDLPSRHEMFVHLRWQDVLMPRLDLTAMLRVDLVQYSRQTWLEARFHWDHADLAIQQQINSGNTGTEYGALLEQKLWQLQVQYFF